MNDQFVLLLNKSYLNSEKPCNSGQFTADQTFYYIESTLYFECLGISYLFVDKGVECNQTNCRKNKSERSIQNYKVNPKKSLIAG